MNKHFLNGLCRLGRFGRPTVIVFFTAAFLLRSATGQQSTVVWDYSPKANHHRAVVEINAGGNGGAGVFIWRYKEKRIGYILSARHVFEPRHSTCTVKFQDGFTSGGTIRSTDPRNDTALIWIDEPPASIPTITIAKNFPPVGSKVEICGYGGQNQFRHFWSEIIPADSGYEASFKSCVISGDSGGPVIYHSSKGPRVIAIISGGHRRTRVGLKDQYGQDWSVVYPASGGKSETMYRRLFSHRTSREQSPMQSPQIQSGPAQFYANPSQMPRSQNYGQPQPIVRPERQWYQPQSFPQFNFGGNSYCPSGT